MCGPISWADLIHIAAQSAAKITFIQSAVRKYGGDQKKGEKLCTAYGSTEQWGQFDKLLVLQLPRRTQKAGCQCGEQPPPQINQSFAKLGIERRQIAISSAFFGPDQAATEAKLVADTESAPWVKKYISQTNYEVDLITASTKLSVRGQTINYEAYLYKPKGAIRF